MNVFSQKYTADQIQQIINKLGLLGNNNHIIALSGSLGAGKTTLVQALLRSRGVTDRITSPTFSYYHEYAGSQGISCIHFDLYRLSSAEEFFDMGFHEFFQRPNTLIIIEWPEIIMPFLPSPWLHIVLDYADESSRIITVEQM